MVCFGNDEGVSDPRPFRVDRRDLPCATTKSNDQIANVDAVAQRLECFRRELARVSTVSRLERWGTAGPGNFDLTPVGQVEAVRRALGMKLAFLEAANRSDADSHDLGGLRASQAVGVAGSAAAQHLSAAYDCTPLVADLAQSTDLIQRFQVTLSECLFKVSTLVRVSMTDSIVGLRAGACTAPESRRPPWP